MSKTRILYAVQGTGNGHLSRAGAILPALQKRGEVDL
ncbi:MAG: glycosyl transferase, partial [Bacteroidota bacterium]